MWKSPEPIKDESNLIMKNVPVQQLSYISQIFPYFNTLDIISVLINNVGTDNSGLYAGFRSLNLSTNFIINCIEHSLIISPLKTKKIMNFLQIFTAEKCNHKSTSKYIRDILVHAKIIKSQYTRCSLDEVISIFPKNSIEEAIKEDNDEEFANAIFDPKFDPNYAIKAKECSYIEALGYSSITLIQLIALFGSVKCFDIALASQLFDCKGIDVFAIAGGNKEIIQRIQETDKFSSECYEVAIKFHRNDLADWLWNNYDCKMFPLFKTLEYFNNRAFLFFIENGIDTGIESINRALITAVKTENIEAVYYLFQKYAIYPNAFILDKSYNFDPTFIGATPLFISEYFQNKDISNFLIQKGGQIFPPIVESQYFINDITKVVKNGDILNLRWLIEAKGININSGNLSQQILYIACSEGYLPIVKYLVENCRVDPRKSTSRDDDPLIQACLHNNIEVVKYLIEKCGVDPNPKRENNGSALHSAIISLSIDIVEYLCNISGINPNVKDEYGSTPLYYACKGGFTEGAKCLYEKCKSDARLASVTGATPLHAACSQNNIEIVKLLVEECKVDINKVDNEGKSALHYACIKEDLEIVKYLSKECGLSANQADNHEMTPLHYAGISENFEIIKYLVENCGGDPTLRDKEGKSPITYCHVSEIRRYLKEYIKNQKIKYNK